MSSTIIDTVDGLQEVFNDLIQIESHIADVNQAVANINANMINYQWALNNINDDYYNIIANTILAPPIFYGDGEEPTIMDGILAEEDTRRNEAARIIQLAWVSKKLYS